MVGQNGNETSLPKKKVNQASTDEEKAIAIADLAWSIKYTDPARAIELGDQAIELSQSINLETNIPKCYLSKAMGLLQMSHFKDAEKSGQMGLSSYRKLDNQTGVRHALNVIGSIYFRWGKYASALEYYLKSLEIHIKLNDTPDPGILSNIGAVYLQLGDTDRALECFTQVKKMADKVEGPADLKIATCVNIAEVYSRMSMYDDALEFLTEGYEICLENDMKQAIAATADNIGTVLTELGRYDDAMKSFNESISIFKSLDDVKGEALVLANMGKCTLAVNSGKAMEFYLESIKKFRSLNDSQGIAEALIGISRVMVELGRNDVALEKLGEALEVAQKVGLKPQLSQIHEILSSILENEGKFDTALKHLKLYHEIENVLRSERADSRLRSLRVIHHVEKAREEATKYMLQNIELEEDRNKLEEMVRSRDEELSKDNSQQEFTQETRKQLEGGAGSDLKLQILTDHVSRIAQDLNCVLTYAIEGTEHVLQDKTLSEKTLKKLQSAVASIRDGFPLSKQLLSLCNSESGEAEVSESTSNDALKNESISEFTIDRKVLVVEDEPEVAEHLMTTLEANGYPVIISDSLDKAREIISGSIDDIGCILVNILMSDGSSLDFIREVRELKPNFPLLAGSIFPLSKQELEYLKENSIMFLQKPYRIDSLMLILSTILPQAGY